MLRRPHRLAEGRAPGLGLGLGLGSGSWLGLGLELAYPNPFTLPLGVHLLLDVLPALLFGGGELENCQMLVCGQADPADAYAQRCAVQMRALRAAYPLQFWAQPDRFFAG